MDVWDELADLTEREFRTFERIKLPETPFVEIRSTPKGPNWIYQMIKEQEMEAYLVVCQNGFARGWLLPSNQPLPDQATIPKLQDCALLRNKLCTCGSQQHRIIRVIQTGTGHIPEER